MQTSKRNFEQIPVAVVKKIAELFPVARKAGEGPLSIETPAEESGSPRPAGGALENRTDGLFTHEDSRDVAQRVQVETDRHKMIQLVQQLIEKLEEEKLRKNGTD
jgi:hypothetical protein